MKSKCAEGVCIVMGTRPEIIKMWPIIEAAKAASLPYFVLHTNQHYAWNMDRVFFEELGLEEPRFNLDAGSGRHGEQTGRILAGMEQVFLDTRPAIVLVEGDTNSVLAGALAAAKMHIPVGHVEAGLRSRDRRMPEELNRIVADHVADVLFAPTEEARSNLLGEGIDGRRIHLTGNTIVDAVNAAVSRSRSDRYLDERSLSARDYGLLTLHRQENTDDEERLRGALEGAARVAQHAGMPVIYPVHPRTAEVLGDMHGVRAMEERGLRFEEPVGYFGFLSLLCTAGLVLTDSGGIQEEACILKVPCVTLRDSTERPETVVAGANVLAGADPDRILELSVKMLDVPRNWGHPYGDGAAGRRIVDIIRPWLEP